MTSPTHPDSADPVLDAHPLPGAHPVFDPRPDALGAGSDRTYRLK